MVPNESAPMSNSSPVTHSVDAEGVGWITFGDPAARANVFTPEVLAALRAALQSLATPSVRALVLISAKEKIFIAGADLKWLGALADEAAATRAAREGQELFGLIAACKVPVVCAIHGACAGGGYELALACSWRMATDAPETVIGLPEVGLGLIPGWGGCTRLPRLIGTQLAVEHFLKATLVPATDALKTGLVDELVPPAELKARAKATALRFAAEGVPVRPVAPEVGADFFVRQRKLVLTRLRGQPAPLAVLDVVEKSAGLPVTTALDLEAALFGGIAAGAVAKNLIRVFFLKEAARKLTVDAWFPPATAGAPPKPFRTVGIVGAGVMGAAIAHWCALHGHGVILCDSSREAIERGVRVIRELFAEAVQRGKLTHDQAHKMIGGIGITISLEDFEICDLVIEAIVEDLGAKQTLFENLSRIVGPDCVLATNTSALPIDEIGAKATNPGRVVGLHFFNPVSRMPLVELVLSPHTSRATAESALAFVKALGKATVICRSSPGFLVTRVLFFYLNEACRLWQEGVPTEILDGAMREWGWPIGPMRLIDEVGVDVTDFIYGELKRYFPGRFTATTICRRMLGEGMKGWKSGAGFYRYTPGERETLNPALAKFSRGPAVALTARVIQARLNGVMIEETKRVLAEGVLKTPEEADFALLMGAGFPAFRGGLLHYARSHGANLGPVGRG
jgi:3-hydroxyacyl-CoA dehydrogenase/enoyl-CoA hydratase/3-hydroxybutyryl-CoA epimerase